MLFLFQTILFFIEKQNISISNYSFSYKCKKNVQLAWLIANLNYNLLIYLPNLYQKASQNVLEKNLEFATIKIRKSVKIRFLLMFLHLFNFCFSFKKCLTDSDNLVNSFRFFKKLLNMKSCSKYFFLFKFLLYLKSSPIQ